MPGGRDEEAEREHRRELAAYIRTLMDNAGYRTQAELARDLRVESSRISLWLSGEKKGPSAYSLLEIIRAAESRKRGSTGLPVPVAPSADQEGTEAAVAEIVKEMRSGFGKLDRRLQALERQRRHEAGQSPSRGAREA